MIPTIWHSGQSRIMEKVIESVVVWGQGGQREEWESTDCQGSETTLYDSIMIDTCHYALVQTYIMYNTNSEA